MDWAKQVRQRYAARAEQEWERLDRTPIARIEYLITSHCLERYLPPGGRILDAGSGPGRYAIDLARRGCRVTMLDLVPEMLRLGQGQVARAAVGEHVSLTQGNQVALPYADGAFDAAVSLGAPLSHVTDQQARTAIVAELKRVVRPGGVILITGLQKLAGYRSMVYWLDQGFFQQIMTPEQRSRGIVDGSQVWYNLGPGELQEVVRGAGLEVVDCAGCEGLANHLPLAHLAQIETDPKRWTVWKALLLETCNEPSIIGISNHLLVIARNPEAEGQSR